MRTLYLFSFLLLASTGSIFAQDFDERLLVGFTQAELESMAKEDPAELDLMTVFSTRGFGFVDYPKEKEGALDPSTALTIADYTSFNPLAFGLKPHDFARIYYPIVGESSKMLVILPRTELKLMINASEK